MLRYSFFYKALTISAFLCNTALSAEATSPTEGHYAACHETAQKETYEGLAVVTTALNILDIPRDVKSSIGSQEIHTQNNFFEKPTTCNIHRYTVDERNIELDEVANLLNEKGAKASVHYAHVFTTEGLKDVIVKTQNDPKKVMIVAYPDENKNVTYGIVKGLNRDFDKVMLLHCHPKKKDKSVLALDTLLENMQHLDKDHCPYGFIVASVPE